MPDIQAFWAYIFAELKMNKFIIRGNRPLSGSISVSGSKNAALPILFSTILLNGISVIENLPDITDVNVALEIISHFGAKISRSADVVTLDTSALVYKSPPENLTSKIRASSYLIGACLSRFGRAEIQRFGGCNFDNRPIDMHLYSARCLGAETGDNIIVSKKLVGADIYFPKISVGATVNAILMSVGAEGVTRIFGYAKEPHVISLIEFLRSAGASITLSDECITVFSSVLSSGRAKIIPDMIEAGTYIALSLLTDSELKICGADMMHLSSFLAPLLTCGADIFEQGQEISVRGRINSELDIITAPYPAFPTDLQPQTAPLLAKFCGGTIREGVWHNRFGYLSELSKFGVEYKLFDGYAKIFPSKLKSASATAPDLRGGAALLLSALSADGVSEIFNSDIIKRGYDGIMQKLCALGADISEEEC